MNILYHFRTRGSGAEAVHISGIANAFEKMGHTVFFSSPTGIDPRRTAGATPYEKKGGGLLGKLARAMPRGVFELMELFYNLPAYWRNLRMARDHGCSLIYERHAFFLFSTALVARRAGCKLAVEVNELVGDPRIRAQPLLAGLARWADRTVFRQAHLIAVVSPHLKRRAMEYGVAEEKILVLPNAVSEEELRDVRPRDSLRAGLQEGTFVLGFVGWLVEWHRLDFLIEALAAPEFGRVALLLVGEGPLEQALRDLAAARNVRTIFAGPLPHSEMPAAIRAMDACAVPHSNAYRSPIKLFEFMAQGRPVLAPRLEPIEAVVRDGANGLLFDPLSVESFREQFRKLIASNGLCDEIGRNARRTVEEKHTWEKNAEAIIRSLSDC